LDIDIVFLCLTLDGDNNFCGHRKTHIIFDNSFY